MSTLYGMAMENSEKKFPTTSAPLEAISKMLLKYIYVTFHDTKSLRFVLCSTDFASITKKYFTLSLFAFARRDNLSNKLHKSFFYYFKANAL